MKDYNEMARDVLARRDAFMAERERARKKMRYALPALCLCAAALGFAGYWALSAPGSGDMPDAGRDAPHLVDAPTPGHADATPGPGAARAHEAVLVVNEGGGTLSADMDVEIWSYNDLAPRELAEVKAEFFGHTGLSFDDFTVALPEGYAPESFYAVAAPGGAENPGYHLHDYVLRFLAPGGGEASITLSAAGEPLSCCIVWCEDPSPSVIDGKELIIHGFEDMYEVRFSHAGLFFEVTTSGLDLPRLRELLLAVLSAA